MKSNGENGDARMEQTVRFINNERVHGAWFDDIANTVGFRRVRTRRGPDGERLVVHYNPIEVGDLAIRLSETEREVGGFTTERRLQVFSHDPDAVASVADLRRPRELLTVDAAAEPERTMADPADIFSGDQDELYREQVWLAHYLGMAQARIDSL